MHCTVAVFILLMALSLLRLLASYFAALKIRRSSLDRSLTLLESNLLAACATRIHLAPSRLPEVRTLALPHTSPMVIGIRRPVLLLPQSLRHTSDPGFDDRHLIAILSHELLHIRRRDYLVNLIVRLASLPIAWHPAVYTIHGRVRQTREMICDAEAAIVCETSTVYARTLLSLAESIIHPHHPVEAVGLFDRNRKTLEERIMKLTEPQLHVSLAARMTRIFAGVVILIAATTTAATLHITPAMPAVYAAQMPAEQIAAPQAAVPTTGQSVPPLETPPVQTPAPKSAVTPAPTPSPAPSPQPEPRVWTKGEVRDMTPEEREKFDKQMDDVHAQIRKAVSQIDSAKLQQQIAAANLKAISSPEFQKQMSDLQEHLKNLNIPVMTSQFSKLNGPEFKKQMEDLKIDLYGPEFREQMKLNIPLLVFPNLDGAAQSQAAVRLAEPEFKKRMAAAREQLHAQIKQAGGDSDQIQKAVDQFVKEVDEATRDLVRERIRTTAPRPVTTTP